MSRNRFTSPAALGRLADIVAYMEVREYVTIAQIMAVCSMSDQSVGDYLRHLAHQGKVHCAFRAVSYQGGSNPAKWAKGPAPVGKAAESECLIPRNVRVLKEWAGQVPPMFEPMAYLYGRAA